MKNKQTTIQLMVSMTVNHDEKECSADEIAAAAQKLLEYAVNAENSEFIVLEVGEVVEPVYESSVSGVGTLSTSYDYSNHVLSLVE